MKITDALLIDNLDNNIRHGKLSLFHLDTQNKIESIVAEMKSTNDGKEHTPTFTDKHIAPKVVAIWGDLLLDSINTLKRYDFREDSHWHDSTHATNRDFNDIAFGIDRVYKYFAQFTEFEKVLYGADAGYRDHVVHVFRVWLMGMMLLLGYKPEIAENRFPFNAANLFMETPIPEIGRTYHDDEVISIWTIIALCHDLGYPLEKTEKINEAVEKMFNLLGKLSVQKLAVAFQLEHQHINKFLLEFISSKTNLQTWRDDNKEDARRIAEEFGEALSHEGGLFYYRERELYKEVAIFKEKLFATSIQSKYFLKFAKSLENYSHGIISSSILLKSLFYFLESDFNMQEKGLLTFEDARQFLIRREILRAIASHTCREVYHLRTDTLAFLLIFCDELQQWGRPRFAEISGSCPNISVESVEVLAYSSQDIRVKINYSGHPDFLPYAKEQFARWHEILRSAVYDSDRTFNMNIALEYTSDNNKERYEFLYRDARLTLSPYDKLKDLHNIDRILQEQ